MDRRTSLKTMASIATGLATTLPAFGQSEWAPAKPLKMVIGYTPGGPMDQFGRAIGDRLAKRLGQQVIMDYRPGAGQVIAAETVMRAPPDGLTLFLTSSTFASNTLLQKTNFDPLKDFTPVIQLASIDVVVSVNPKLVPVRTPQEFVAWVRSNPTKAFYALPTKGGTGHIVGELMNKRGDLSLQPVYYRGTAPMMTDVVGGQVPIVIETIASLREFARKGYIDLIASSGPWRVPGYPDLPTLGESVFPGFSYTSWYCMHLPAGASKEVVGRLNRELNEIMKDPFVADLFVQGGATVQGGSPSDAAKMLAEYQRVTAQIIKESNISV